MLSRYLASYQLPTTGTKQQLAECLTHHLRSIAAKKIQRSSRQQQKSRAGSKQTQKSARPEAPPRRKSTPQESSNNEEDTGSQDFLSGEQGSLKSPPSSNHKSRSRRANPIQSTMADSALAAPHQRKTHLVTANPVHSTRVWKRHASHSHVPLPKASLGPPVKVNTPSKVIEPNPVYIYIYICDNVPNWDSNTLQCHDNFTLELSCLPTIAVN